MERSTSVEGMRKKVNPLDSLLLVASSIKKNIRTKDASLHSIHPSKLAALTKSCYQTMSEKERRAVDVLGKRLWICDPYRTEHTVEQGFYQKVLQAPEPSKSGSMTFSYSKFVKSKADKTDKKVAQSRKRPSIGNDDDESISSDSSSSSVSSNEGLTQTSVAKRARTESTDNEKIELSNFPKTLFSRKTGTILESKSAREQLYSDLYNQYTPINNAVLPKWKKMPSSTASNQE